MADQDLDPWMRRTSGLRPGKRVRMSTPGGPPPDRRELDDHQYAERFGTARNPNLAMFLSGLIPGAGDVYMGRDLHGAVLIAIYVGLAAVTLSTTIPIIPGLIAMLIVWFVSQESLWRYCETPESELHSRE